MDIDIVYLWVNGNDPEWLAKKNTYLGITTENAHNCKGRFSDNGELKYSLRSIDTNAPWVRRIFIVTDNQVPEWLDTSNPKVQIVDHTDIMPPECLPCYSSVVIEQFLHKIPGLSEHFLYANDDMLIGKPVTPANFFAEDGRPYLFMFRRPFRKLVMWYRENIKRIQLSPYLVTIRNSARLVEKAYGKYYGCKQHHNIDAYTKTMFIVAHEKFGKEISTMYDHHIRTSEDYQRCLYSYVALAEKLGKLRYVGTKHSLRIQIHNRHTYYRFEKYHPVLFCMNDTELANDDDRRLSKEFLENLFPNKSQFEK